MYQKKLLAQTWQKYVLFPLLLMFIKLVLLIAFLVHFKRKGPENVNLLLTALYFRQLCSYFFEKKELAFLDIQEWFSKIQHKLLLKNL
jgi:hypothetical protein